MYSNYCTTTVPVLLNHRYTVRARRMSKGAKSLLKESDNLSDHSKSVVDKELIFGHLVVELEIPLLVKIVEHKDQILGQMTQSSR